MPASRKLCHRALVKQAGHGIALIVLSRPWP
jgi:hypothetical protein